MSSNVEGSEGKKGGEGQSAKTTTKLITSALSWSAFASSVRTVRYEHLAAGVSGGVVSTLVLHPLDLIKIRFAVDDGKDGNRPHYSGLRNAFGSIFKDEGFRGLYKGVVPNVAGAGASWGLYFLFYHTIKNSMQSGDSKVQLSPAKHMLAAAESGVITLAFTNPIWVIKTRLCLQYDLVSNGPGVNSTMVYRGMFDAFLKISKYEGIRGLYRGFVPGLWGVSHGAIQFMVYEELKTEYNKYKGQSIDTKLGTMEYLCFAALSKLVAATATYPYQVVRARLQDQNKAGAYAGALDCVRQTLRDEGPRGFYKGLVPNLNRVIPATGITFVVYEKVSHKLGKLWDDQQND